MRTKLETSRFQLILPTKMLNQLRQIAQEEAVPVSELIKIMIRTFLEDRVQ
jgi:metal-responsive CopG/Arc/MetJ family transcriptional regulator